MHRSQLNGSANYRFFKEFLPFFKLHIFTDFDNILRKSWSPEERAQARNREERLQRRAAARARAAEAAAAAAKRAHFFSAVEDRV